MRSTWVRGDLSENANALGNRHTNDLETAEADLTKAISMQGNCTDPFMHALLGMTHEKMRHADAAKQWYQKAYDLATQHTPPSAFTRAFARKKLGA
jgi:hypothetical protein